MRWLAERFGIDRLLSAKVVLPTEQFFDIPVCMDARSVRRLLDRMCGYMGVPPDKVSLEIVPDEQMPGAAGQYHQHKRSLISIARSQLGDPVRLLATLSHELSHELLLGNGLLTTSTPDHEWITDLLPVFLGTGVFLANATIQEASGHSGTLSWWRMSRQGYLPSRMFGYAFALFAFVRGETDLSWVEHLRLDARSTLYEGLRFLNKSGDSLIHPETIHEKVPPLTPATAIEQLRRGTPTVRLSTLWGICDWNLAGPEIVTAVQSCLDDRDPYVIAEAAWLLGCFGTAAEAAIPRLLDVLWRSENNIKIRIAQALGGIHARQEIVVPELIALLSEESAAVVDAAAEALSQFGKQAASAVPKLLVALKPALVNGNSDSIRLLAAALQAVSDNPHRLLCDSFEDPELRRLALEALPPQKN